MSAWDPDPYRRALPREMRRVTPPPRAPIVAAPLPRAWTLNGEPVLLGELPAETMRAQARAMATVGERVTVRIAGRPCVLERAH